MFLLDSNGLVVNKADLLMRKARHKGISHFPVEVSKSFIEIGSRPHGRVLGLTRNFFSNLEKVIETAESIGLHLYPFGAYPGKSTPIMRSRPWYNALHSIFGQAFVDVACKVCSFQFHFSTPRGVIDRSEGVLSAKIKRSRDVYLNQFNFLVAADPALSTFLQSSPYHDGELVGKDARMFLWRAMKAEKGAPFDGLFSSHSLFGGLPRYATSIYDLKALSEKRKRAFVAELRRKTGSASMDILKRSPLKFDWGPVRANPLGTIEVRGMDMNTPMQMIAASSLLKRFLREIFLGNVNVVVDELAIRKPFLLEDGVVFIPPYSYVNSELQYLSASEGLESKKVHGYCKAFYKTALQLNSDNKRFLSGVEKMLSTRKTKADEIIDAAGRAKSIALDEQGELALKLSRNFLDETEKVREIISHDFEAI